MYKLAFVALFALFAVASAGLVAPIVSGISTTQRLQSHVPIATVGVPLVLGKGIGLGGLGLGVGGLGLGVGGLGLGKGIGLGLGGGIGLNAGVGVVPVGLGVSGLGLGLGGVGIIG